MVNPILLCFSLGTQVLGLARCSAQPSSEGSRQPTWWSSAYEATSQFGLLTSQVPSGKSCIYIQEQSRAGAPRSRLLIGHNRYVGKVPASDIPNPSSETTHNGHAVELASNLDLGSFDAVLTVSGDGLVHEVLNGFSKHAEPLKALSMPLAPIPAGSGNALSLNLLGIKVISRSLPNIASNSLTIVDRMDSMLLRRALTRSKVSGDFFR